MYLIQCVYYSAMSMSNSRISVLQAVQMFAFSFFVIFANRLSTMSWKEDDLVMLVFRF